MSIFTNCLPEQASLRVLDLFLLEGMQSNKIIFDVTLAYLSILEKQIVTIENFNDVFSPNNKEFVDCT